MSKPVILCVDDEKIVLDSLKSQIRENVHENFDLEIAESGEEAIEIIEELLEDGVTIPVIISDHIMPGIKGDELLISVNRLSPNTSKILLTGQADADAIGNAVNKAKLYRYIAKPWDSTDLILTITEAYKTFFQSEKLEEQNVQLKNLVDELKQLNDSLEQKVQERTAEIERQKNEIEKKNQDITASITYAKRIQDVMLPSTEIMENNFKDYFVFFKPRDIVSGDFYYFREKYNKVLISAVDCTGHGVPGAIMSMVGLEQIEEIIDIYNITNPKLLLETLHKGIRKVLKQEDEQSKETMDMALCTIDKEKNTLEFSGAKNPLIYIYENEEGQPITQHIKADRQSVGGIQKEIERVFTNHIIPIDRPITFYIFSDGFQDQFGGPQNRKFTIRRMKKLFVEVYKEPLKKQHQIIGSTLDEWKGDERQIDDILIIGFKL